MRKKGLEIVILTKNRPGMLERAINAIDQLNFDLPVHKVVSDNSTNSGLIQVPYDWELRIRNSVLSAYEHHKKVLEEMSHEWSLFTHDDDELTQNFATLISEFNKDINVGIISGIGEIRGENNESSSVDGYRTKIRRSRIKKYDPLFNKRLFQIQLQLGSIMPFSAIAIRTEILDTLIFPDVDFGYAIDYYYALNICLPIERIANKVVFSSLDPVMIYHTHINQDSKSLGMKTTLPMLSVIAKISAFENAKTLWGFKHYLKIVKDLFIAQHYLHRSESAYVNHDLLRILDMTSLPYLQNKKINNLILNNPLIKIIVIGYYLTWNKIIWKTRVIIFGKNSV